MFTYERDLVLGSFQTWVIQITRHGRIWYFSWDKSEEICGISPLASAAALFGSPEAAQIKIDTTAALQKGSVEVVQLNIRKSRL